MAKPITNRQNSLDQWRGNTNIVSTNVGDPETLYTNTGGAEPQAMTIPADCVVSLNDLNTRKINKAGDTIDHLTITAGTHIHDGIIDLNTGDTVRFLSTATGSTAQTTIVTVGAASAVRAGEINIRVNSGSDYQFSKLVFIHNGSNVNLTEIAVLITNVTLAVFTADIVGENVILQSTSTNASTNYEISLILLK